MWVASLGRQRRPLAHAEAVLLVGDHQPQPVVFHAAGDQRVGADDQIRLSQRQPLQHVPPRPRPQRAGQQRAAHAQSLQQGGKTLVVLLRQNFRGGHQGGLPPVFHAEVDARRRHHGLAGANVALTEPVHGPAGAHIRQRLVHAPPLGRGEGEGQRLIKALHIHGPERVGAGRVPPGAQPPQPQREEEQLLKGQPPPRQLQRLRRGGEVDVLIGEADVAEMMLLPHVVGQRVGQDAPAGVQPLPDGAGENELAHPGGEGIDRDDAPGLLAPARRFHHRVDHPAAVAGALGPAIKNVGLPGGQAALQPRLVEKRHVQRAGRVHRPQLYQLQPPPRPGQRGRRGHHGLHAGGH